jgi:hypothetical protein
MKARNMATTIVTKNVEKLNLADFDRFPVWQYTNDDEGEFGEMGVRPIIKTPVKNLNGCIVGSRVRLANAVLVRATLSNVDSADLRSTQHFLALSIWHDGHWFHLARYFDVDYEQRGPKALADFLALPLDQVFPISYDISQLCIGESAALIGSIEKEPREKLTRAQIFALAVPKP